MTKKQAFREFIDAYGYESENVLKARIKDRKISKVTVRYEFLAFVDYLLKDHQISEKQANTWCCPSWLY